MKIEKNKHYKLHMNLHGRREDYKGKVLEVNGPEFRFETEDDNLCRALTLKQEDIIKIKEIPEPKKEGKIHRISNKKQFTNLRETEKPEF